MNQPHHLQQSSMSQQDGKNDVDLLMGIEGSRGVKLQGRWERNKDGRKEDDASSEKGRENL